MSTFITNLIFNFPFMEIHEKHHKVSYKIELTSSLRFWSYILKFVLIPKQIKRNPTVIKNNCLCSFIYFKLHGREYNTFFK